MTKTSTTPKSSAALAKLPKSSLFNLKDPSIKAAAVSTYRKKRTYQLLPGKWHLLAATEIEKAQRKHRLPTFHASKSYVSGGSRSYTTCTMSQTFARTASQVISAALRAVSDELGSDLNALSRHQLPQECNIQEEVPMVDYGYQDVSLTSNSHNSQSASPCQNFGRPRRYQRRGSVTEFSLKAAAIAKMQLDSDDDYRDASSDVMSGNK